MTRHRTKRTAKKRGQNQRDQTKMVIPRPMGIPNIGLTHNVKVRYSTSAAVALSLSWKNILDSWLVATTAVQGYQLFDMVKIRCVEVWSYSASGPVTCTVTFPGGPNSIPGALGDGTTHTDTSMGLEPAYIRAVPGRKSGAALFQGQASTTYQAFDIFCPSGSVVDVSFSFRMSMAGYAPVAVTNALVGAQVGNVYARGLDGIAAATTKFQVQGIPDWI